MDNIPCERWMSIPWRECNVPASWLVHVTECHGGHLDTCQGHGYCEDHIVKVMLDRTWNREIVQIVPVEPVAFR